MGTFNGERHLSAQLDSIALQTRQPDELVVADDGSTDATLALLEAFRSAAPFDVRILRNDQRLGVTHNFERAIAACTGTYVVLSDQDDVWLPQRVEQSIAALGAAPRAGYVFSNAQIMGDDGASQPDTLWDRVGLAEDRRQRYRSGDQLATLLNGPNFIYGMTMTLRRTFLADVLPIASQSQSCTHDTWAALTMSGSGHDGILIDACLVLYRQHAHQVVGAGDTRISAGGALLRSLRSKRNFDSLFPADLEAAADRIEAAGTDIKGSTAARRLRAKAAHLRMREQLATLSVPQRTVSVTKELLSGRYAQYSDSWKTAVRDIIG